MTSKPNDKLLLLILSFLGLLGLFAYFKLQDQVFPGATINFDLSRDQIMSVATMWKDRVRVPGKYPITSSTFALDSGSKNYLDFKLGTREANRIMSEEAPIFWWDVRFAEEKNEESVEVQISPGGKLVALVYYLSKDRVLPSISHEEAKARALTFISELTGKKEDRFEIKNDETTPRAGRVDHSFTLEARDYDWAGAKLRTSITYSGNLLTEYNSYVWKPETWERQYSKMRSRNELLQQIAQIFYVLLHPVALFLAITQLQRGNLRMRFAIIAAAAFVGVSVIDQYNDLPYNLAGYSSDKSYIAFLAQLLLQPLSSGLIAFVGSLILIASAEFVYRKTFPDKLALEGMLTKSGLGSHEVRTGLVIGIVWCAVSLGYQILYYFLGRKVGFWCPIQLDQYQLLGSFFPWIGAIGLGVQASGSEEILYRILFLCLMKPLVKRYWLANLLQAAGWGFMHSSYEQQPCYARGLELTIEGMLDGWLLKRFGLLPCLVSHYLFDAFCCVLPLLKAPLPLQATAAIPLVPVLLLLALSFIFKNHGVPLKNSDIAVKTIVQEKTSPLDMSVSYLPVHRQKRWLMLVAIGVLLPLGALLSHTVERIGDNTKKLKLTRQQAIDKAREYLTEQQFDLSGYKHYVQYSNSYGAHYNEFQYIREKLGLKKTIELADKIEHTCLVSVQFIKPLTPRTYGVTMAEDGRLLSLDLKMAEEDRMREISKEEAQSLVRAFIRQYRPEYYPLDNDQYSSKRMPQRIDHTVGFKLPVHTVADAPLKVSMNVIGDRAANITHYWDVPEKWTWKRELKGKKEEILQILGYVITTIMALCGIYSMVQIFRRYKVTWRIPLFGATIMVVFNLLASANDLINLYARYDYTKPLQSFYMVEAINKAAFIFLPPLAMVFMLATILAAMPPAIRQKLKCAYVMLMPAHLDEYSKTHRDYWLDALLIGGSAAALSFLVSSIYEFCWTNFAREISVRSDIGALASDLNSFVPSAVDVLSLLRTPLDAGLSLGMMVALALTLGFTSFKKTFPLLLLYFIYGAASERHLPDFAITLANNIVVFSFNWFLITRFAGGNLLGLVLFSFYTACLTRLNSLLHTAPTVCSADIVATVVMMCLPPLYLLYNQRIHRLSKKLKIANRSKILDASVESQTK